VSRGKRVGQTEVSLQDIKKIIELTKEGLTRGEIASAVKRSKSTVFLYQKKYGVI
jgi:orotate phosphoribosyltransferase-like protein